jgi:hypothetical protein
VLLLEPLPESNLTDPLKRPQFSTLIKIPRHVYQSLMTLNNRPIIATQKFFLSLARQGMTSKAAPNIISQVCFDTPIPKLSAIRSIRRERQELVKISDLAFSSQTNACVDSQNSPKSIRQRSCAARPEYILKLCQYSKVVS